MAKTKAKAPVDSSAPRKNRSRHEDNRPDKQTDLVAQIISKKGALPKFDKLSRQLRREAVCTAVQEGLALRLAPKATWAAFVKSTVWDNDKARPKLDQQNEAVRFVMLVYEDGSSRRSKEASDVFRAVEHLRRTNKSDKKVVQALRDSPSIRAILDETREMSTSKSGRDHGSEPTGKQKAASTNTVKAKKAPQRARRNQEDYADSYFPEMIFEPKVKRPASLANGTEAILKVRVEDAGRTMHVLDMKVI